jgi:hypothetical protein
MAHAISPFIWHSTTLYYMALMASTKENWLLLLLEAQNREVKQLWVRRFISQAELRDRLKYYE